MLGLYRICFLFIAVQNIQASPFLYNTGQAIFSSLFSKPSNASNSENIEDLRAMKEEKQNFETLGMEEFFQRTEKEEEMKNEDPPKFYQKKIMKVLAKLSALQHLQQTIRGNQADTDKTEDLISTEIPNNIYKVNQPAYSAPLPPIEPRKFSLFPEEKDDLDLDAAFDDNFDDDGDGNKINLSQGGVGVYLIELFSGLATLIYGAALQVANFGRPRSVE